MFNLDSSLGISFQGDSLILASVKKGLQDYALKRHLIIRDFRDLSKADLHDRIHKFVKSNGFSRENIILGFPRDQVIVRQVELPAEVEENLDQVVRSQVDRFEPSEEERSYYDHLVVHRDGENNRIVIQIVMVKQGLLDDYLALLTDLDLYPAAIRYTSVGLQSILLSHKDGHPKRSTVVVLQISEERLEILVVSGRRHQFSKSVPIPEGTVGVEWVLNELDLFLGRLEPRLDEINKLYLAGEGAREILPELRKEIEDCELLVENLRLGRKGITERALDRILPTIGLAISGISKLDSARLNLIPGDRRLRGGRPSLIATYVLAAALAVMLGGLATRSFFQERALVDEVAGQAEILQVRVDDVYQLRDQVAGQQAAVIELQQMMAGRQQVLIVLRDLTERIPDDTYLTTVQMLGNEISMQGYSDQASDLLSMLLQSPYLENVKTNWINKDQRSGKDRFNFSATVKNQ